MLVPVPDRVLASVRELGFRQRRAAEGDAVPLLHLITTVAPWVGRLGLTSVLTSWPQELPSGSGPSRFQQAGRCWLCQEAPQRSGCPDTNIPSSREERPLSSPDGGI